MPAQTRFWTAVVLLILATPLCFDQGFRFKDGSKVPLQ